jgi:hypothetical protein
MVDPNPEPVDPEDRLNVIDDVYRCFFKQGKLLRPMSGTPTTIMEESSQSRSSRNSPSKSHRKPSILKLRSIKH